MDDMRTGSVLEGFSPWVRQWFSSTFDGPTAVQEAAWPRIQAGGNVLVVAPTGSGKTLAAFLMGIDGLVREDAGLPSPLDQGAPAKADRRGVEILYVSPMKALAADVEKNLRAPLDGVAEVMAREAGVEPAVTIGMRTGDTPQSERQRMVRNPPRILITTPESLYLILTSKARSMLAGVRQVIVDEVHAIAGSKRGAHLSLSLERLDALLERPAQRIGLSATVRPVERVAEFLGGAAPCEVVDAGERPAMDLTVRVPVDDLTAVPVFSPRRRAGAPHVSEKDAWKTDRTLKAQMAGAEAADKPARGNGNAAMERRLAAERRKLTRESRAGSRSIWPHIEAEVLDQVEAHGSTIVFVNSRGLCERLCSRLNELHAERLGWVAPAAEEGAYRGSYGSPATHVVAPPEGMPVVARAHHGSVSKEKRAQIESDLKSGQLKCVVATSSLELGIDMGSVDLVLQVGAPLSVAAGLQRVGRANHFVRGRSQAVLYPRTRMDVLDCTVAAAGMLEGAIEETRLVRQPLDVLAQQTVARATQGPFAVGDWLGEVRRSANYRDLSRVAMDSVLTLLAGETGGTELGAVAPRIQWDRDADTVSVLPLGSRLAVALAGTIPDRGLYPVLVENEVEPGATGKTGRGTSRRRVGELDEEMVHESRVGDVIMLGTTSWRITRIENDRVLVQRADATAARLPFWHGEGPSRPYEDGKRKGALLRELDRGLPDAAGQPDRELERDLERWGLEKNARANLCALAVRQRAATGAVPSDRELVVEYAQDETGDLRMVLHSPFGRAVHEPWTLAVSERVRRRWGFDPEAMAADDGIVMRVPEPGPGASGPGPDVFVFEDDELRALVQSHVAETALFAARFRECCARALLVTPRDFGKRAPLWLQRMQAGQLLEAAKTAESHPLLVEAARECLTDVYDLDGLLEVMGGLRSRRIQIHSAHTAVPSPFCANLLFGYTMAHLYDDDKPHAERRAAALAVDPALLGEILGTPDAASLVDPEVIEQVGRELQWLAPGRKATGREGVATMLRTLGPLSTVDVAARCDDPDEAPVWLDELDAARRIALVRIAGEPRWAVTQDLGLLQDVLGCEVPAWAPPAPALPPRTSGLMALASRYAKTHGPFSTEALAAHLGLGRALVADALGALCSEGSVLSADYGTDEQGARRWVATSAQRLLRARSLEKARSETAPQPAAAWSAQVLRLQAVGLPVDADPLDALAECVSVYEGVFLEPGLWESQVFPARVRGYRPALLDELLASGDVVWQGGSRASERPGANEGAERRVAAFFPTDSPFAPLPAAGPGDIAVPSETESLEGEQALRAGVLAALAAGGRWSFDGVMAALRAQPAPEAAAATPSEASEELTRLLWEGTVLNQSFSPARRAATAATSKPARPTRRSRSRYGSRAAAATRASAVLGDTGAVAAPAASHGLWSAAVEPDVPAAERAIALVGSLLARYGVLAPSVATVAGVPGGFQALYPVLRAMEEAGVLLRGTFVEGLGNLQFATRDTVEALRAVAESEGGSRAPVVVLGAADPANVFGACVPWPAPVEGPGPDEGDPAGTPVSGTNVPPDGTCVSGTNVPRLSRAAGAMVAFSGGAPVLYAAPRLKSLAVFSSDEDSVARALEACARWISDGARRNGTSPALEKLLVESVNGEPALKSPWAPVLQSAGFVRSTDGLRLYLPPL
ncbi:DEAD/DEAH box helicase [Kribbibacterium absianum]|uniref:DEAD/DEAH box helicase n=1 Tax=Kribbibacterium absianum TaxID=3044210 RepID=UPI0024BD2155|nr:DEAD/DEAH box helicase [Olsenella sp. YH-ols2216]MDJ1122334.1 DEAD/DEAH box helicase [Olsenella sp. YH-ols2216]